MMAEADKDGNGVIDCEGRVLHVSHPILWSHMKP